MSEKRYDEKILHALLDRYERSLLYTGENRRNQTIAFPVNRRTLPEYFDESSRRYETIHEQLMDLEHEGLVTLSWKGGKAGHILEKCLLVPEAAKQSYMRLHRTPKRQKEAQLLKICAAYLGRNPVLDRYLNEIRGRLERGERVGQYTDPEHPEALAQRCGLMLQILENQEEIFLREFSVRYRKDSKAAEKEIAGAAGMIARFSENQALEELQTEQILEEYLIYKNPSYVMMKGRGSIVQPACLRLSDWPGGIGLSGRDIGKLCFGADDAPKQVVTIENLTSFHRWDGPESLAVYLGGYHNRVKREFLRRLYQAYPQAEYFHFGDIDCGGFRIWKDLCRKTEMPFQPLYMDEKTFLQHLQYGRELTENDRRDLKKLAEDPFFAGQRTLFGLMLEKNRKIEQECIAGNAGK